MAKRQVVKVIDFLANELRKNGLTISKIILFGSQAKGRASAESDIDVAIASEDFRDNDIFQTPEELCNDSSIVAGYIRSGKVLHAA